jgi:hypothetical protein
MPNNRIVNECEAAGGMIVGRGNRVTSRLAKLTDVSQKLLSASCYTLIFIALLLNPKFGGDIFFRNVQ